MQKFAFLITLWEKEELPNHIKNQPNLTEFLTSLCRQYVNSADAHDTDLDLRCSQKQTSTFAHGRVHISI